MERYDEAEISWLRFLGVPDHVIDFMKTEDGLHTGRATRITLRIIISIVAILVLMRHSPGERFASLSEQFPEVADAFLRWQSLDSLALSFAAFLAGAACLTNVTCFLFGIGWRKAAGDVNIFAERVGESPWFFTRPFLTYLWRFPLALLMMAILRLVPQSLPPDRFLTRLTVTRFLFWATVAVALTQVAANNDRWSIEVLNTTGYFERDSTGGEQRDSWSELRSFDASCSGRNNTYPSLLLRFASGRTVNLGRMTGGGGSGSTGFARVDDIRRSQAIPIVWTDPSQQQLFRENPAQLRRCVNEMLSDFPPERRNALRAALRG